MRARVFIAVLALAAAACTSGSGTTSTTTESSASPLPTTNVQASIVPGEWTYPQFRGISASFTWKDGPPSLTVKNTSGAQIDAPGVYVVTQDQQEVHGTLPGAAPLADGEKQSYEVSFPGDLTVSDVGLIVLLIGNANWGALSPKVVEG